MKFDTSSELPPEAYDVAKVREELKEALSKPEPTEFSTRESILKDIKSGKYKRRRKLVKSA